MRNLRWVLLALVGVVLTASLAALILALTKGGQAQQSVTLGLAFGSIALTVAKILLDMLVSPGEQALARRRGRHEERVESVAGRVRQLLGLQGSMLLGHIEDAWHAGDVNAIRDRATLLADAAELAYHECESASDALEILVGVLIVEARELGDDAEILTSVPLAAWDDHEVAKHKRLVAEYLGKIQERLHDILDAGRSG